MALEKILKVTGTAVHVPGSDIDTDRIIPARFMKCVTFDGLGEYAFYDVRFDENGNRKPHPLNDPRFHGASILLSGSNFGCGSSREHAPQALSKFGIRAIIAESFAEIFFGNSTTLGIPCVIAASDDIKALGKAIEQTPKTEVTVDVENLRVTCTDPGSGATTSFPIHLPDSAHEALTSGRWDPIGELLEGEAAVAETAAALPYMEAGYPHKG